MDQLDALIELAFAEDIGPGDITTNSIISPDDLGVGVITAKEDFLLAGDWVAERVFKKLDPDVKIKKKFSDGDEIKKGDKIMILNGRLDALLIGERTALNFIQRLSGIATLTRTYVNEIKGTGVRLTDTRKTTPGMRGLEKYAVRVGGAYNHRAGLFDGVLIKDNHIAAGGGIKKAVHKAREAASHLLKIELEVTSLKQVKEALKANADVIMLDNMDIPAIVAAVEIIGDTAIKEVSGNVTKQRLKELAKTGVDVISSGAITHSARSIDISMSLSRKK